VAQSRLKEKGGKQTDSSDIESFGLLVSRLSI
jgi:hypothetical protein